MDLDEILIQEVKKREYLYNKRLKSYRNVELRVAGWKEISEVINEPENVCKTRWKTLRDRFCKEVGKSPSGSGVDETVCKWPLIEHLGFLRDHITPRKTVTNYRVINKTGNQGADQEENPLPTIILPQQATTSQGMNESNVSDSTQKRQSGKKNTREKSSIDESFSRFIGNMEKVVTQVLEPKPRDDNAPFLQMVSDKLNLLPSNAREDVKMEILLWLHEKVNSFTSN